MCNKAFKRLVFFNIVLSKSVFKHDAANERERVVGFASGKLTGSSFASAKLTGGYVASTKPTGAYFVSGKLTGSNFTNGKLTAIAYTNCRLFCTSKLV